MIDNRATAARYHLVVPHCVLQAPEIRSDAGCMPAVTASHCNQKIGAEPFGALAQGETR